MFDHLDDPTPPAAGPEVRAAVDRRVTRHRRRSRGVRSAVLAVAVLGGVVGVLAATGSGPGSATVDVADAPGGDTTRCCGVVHGAVTADGAPAEGLLVALLHRNGTVKSSTTTDAAGAYRFEGIEDDAYLVQFIDESYQRRTEWWDDATLPADARPVLVRADRVAVADAELEPAPGQGLRGTVFVRGGWPIADVTVWLFAEGDLVRGARTDDEGRFAMPALEPGEYELLLWDDERDRFASEWYRDAPDRERADPVVIVEGDDTEVNLHVGP